MYHIVIERYWLVLITSIRHNGLIPAKSRYPCTTFCCVYFCSCNPRYLFRRRLLVESFSIAFAFVLSPLCECIEVLLSSVFIVDWTNRAWWDETIYFISLDFEWSHFWVILVVWIDWSSSVFGFRRSSGGGALSSSHVSTLVVGLMLWAVSSLSFPRVYDEGVLVLYSFGCICSTWLSDAADDLVSLLRALFVCNCNPCRKVHAWFVQAAECRVWAAVVYVAWLVVEDFIAFHACSWDDRYGSDRGIGPNQVF